MKTIQIPDPTVDVPRNKRSFLPVEFEVTDWESLKPFYDQLLEAEITSRPDLEEWLRKWSELDSVVREDMAWRYIKMTCDTKSEEHLNAYKFFVSEILPNLSSIENKLERKLVADPFLAELDHNKYHILIRAKKNQIELFREENIPLFTEMAQVAQQFDQIAGGMTIEIDGETLTLQKAAALLEKRDQPLREKVWKAIVNRRVQEVEKLDVIFNDLIKLRHKVAQNADFKSYTAFKFLALGRFDYTQEDCDQFHNSIAKVVKPIYKKDIDERRQKLGLETMRPWDLNIDVYGEEPLRPFKNSRELIDMSVRICSRLRPELGEMIETMDKMGHLDVESRIGKSPGGYNYPLAETGIPFIFMNAVGTQSDLSTMLHESGHAIHAFLTQDLELHDFKEVTSEVAELASMSMELITMDFWDEVYPDPADLKRAKRDQIMRTLTLLPWIATIDNFQKWTYDNPNHTEEERRKNWVDIYKRFHGSSVDWSGFEHVLDIIWQKQGHIFDVPFYYIEYGMAQLGAIAVWRNYKQDPEKGLEKYLDALELGYTKTIPEIYEAAGIRFDFSESYIRELSEFVMEELEKLSA